MERGLGAPLSPHEEVSFRRVALGIWKAKLLPAGDVERLKAKRYQVLPNITAVRQPEKPDAAVSKLATLITKARG
jgi:hypothetical protein